jgi:hypothetical protein
MRQLSKRQMIGRVPRRSWFNTERMEIGAKKPDMAIWLHQCLTPTKAAKFQSSTKIPQGHNQEKPR